MLWSRNFKDTQMGFLLPSESLGFGFLDFSEGLREIEKVKWF